MAEEIVYESLPDDKNRCTFFIYWLDYDYDPPKQRGQIFFADPREHGFPLPKTTDDLYMRINKTELV